MNKNLIIAIAVVALGAALYFYNESQKAKTTTIQLGGTKLEITKPE